MADNSNSNEGFVSILKEPAPITAEGRPLTSGEIAEARAVFGDSIDYDQVRIHDEQAFFDDRMVVFNGEIYAPGSEYQDDFSTTPLVERSMFLHEMTHVWQDQNDIDADGAQRQKDIDDRGGNYEHLYNYILEEDRPFLDYNVEQQGEIVRDYFFKTKGLAYPDKANIGLDDYEDLLPFDEDGGERPLVRVAPINEDGSPANTGSQTGPRIAPINEDGSPATPAPQAGTSDPGTAPGLQPEPSPGPAAPPLAAATEPPANVAPQPDPTPEPQSSPETAAAAEPPARAAPQSGPQGPTPTLADLLEEAGEEYVDPNEERAVTEAEGNEEETDAAGDEDDDEQGTGANSEMPNPVDDGPSYTNSNFSVLLNRNAPYVNPGPDDIGLLAGDTDFSVLLNRNAPYVNPGPGDFDILTGDTDFSVLLNRNAPYVNPGLGDIDLPAGDTDLSVLFNRNGPRTTSAPADSDLPDSTVDSFVSDFDFAPDLDDLAGFEIG